MRDNDYLEIDPSLHRNDETFQEFVLKAFQQVRHCSSPSEERVQSVTLPKLEISAELPTTNDGSGTDFAHSHDGQIPVTQSTIQKAVTSGIPIPDDLKVLAAVDLPPLLPLPDASGKLVRPTLREYAISQKFDPTKETEFYSAVFMSSDDQALRKEAVEGLRDMVLSGRNPSAMQQYQTLMAIQASIDLKEAERRPGHPAGLLSLMELTNLARVNKLAHDVLAEKRPDWLPNPKDVIKATVNQAHQTWAPIDLALTVFLARSNEIPEGRESERETAIVNLEKANRARLTLMHTDDCSALVRSLRALDAALTIKETSSPERAAEVLQNLMALASDGRVVNTDAINLLKDWDTNLKGTDLQTLLLQLQQKGPGADAALKQLQNASPILEPRLNELRVERITRSLKPDATSEDLNIAIKQLTAEKALGNKDAEPMLQALEVAASVQRLNEAATRRQANPGDSADDLTRIAAAEIAFLKDQMKFGNGHAKLALIDLIAAKKGADQEYNPSRHLPYKLPTLHGFSDAERSQIQLLAAKSFREELNASRTDVKPFLNKENATAVATSLITAHRTGEADLTEELTKLFRDAFCGTSTRPAMKGILDAIESDPAGSSILGKIYIAGTDNKTISEDLRSLSLMAASGNQGATKILVLITAGQANGENHSEYAPAARKVLELAATNPVNRNKIYNEILDATKFPPKTGELMLLLGRMASKDESPSEDIRQTLRTGLLRASMYKHKAACYEGTLEGFISASKHWDKNDYDTLKKLSPAETAKSLRRAQDVPDELKHHILADQSRLLTSGSKEECLAAIDVMAGFGKKASPMQAQDIAWLATKNSKEYLKNLGLTDTDQKQFSDKASVAIVAMLGADDQNTRAVAIAALREKRDWPGILSNPKVREQILDYVQGRPTDLELNKDVRELLYDAGIPRPLAGVFKDAGVTGTKGQDLFAMTEKAIKNYSSNNTDGEKVVRQVLANVERINALPVELRQAITGSPEKIDPQTVIGQLVNGTIDAGHPQNNPLFQDLDRKIAHSIEITDSLINKRYEELAQLKSAKDLSVSHLKHHTVKNKVSVGERFVDAIAITEITGLTDFEKTFEKTQGIYVGHLRDKLDKIKEKEAAIDQLVRVKAALQLAKDAGGHASLSMDDQKAADVMLMRMVSAHGALVLRRDLPEAFSMLPAAFDRLNAGGHGLNARIELYHGPWSFEKSLAQVKDVRIGTVGTEGIEGAAAKKIAFEPIDALPAFNKLRQAAAEFSARMPLLHELFNCGLQGSRYGAFVNLVRAEANKINEIMDSVKSADLEEAKKAVKRMEETLGDDFANVSKGDSRWETKQELQKRIEAIRGAIDLFDPRTKQWEKLHNMLDMARSDKFDETTAWNWFRTDGVVLIASMTAAAAVLAVTGGVGAPLAAGLVLGAAASITAGEVTKEIQRASGVRSDGSLIGDYHRGKKITDEQTGELREMNEWGDVWKPYLTHLAEDLAIIVATMGLARGTSEALSPIRNTVRRIVDSPSERKQIATLAADFQKAEAVAAKVGKPGFVREFMHQMRENAIFSGQATAAGAAVEAATGDVHLPTIAKHLPALAVGAGRGLRFKPTDPSAKSIEYNLDGKQHSQAKDLVEKQMVEFHNAGNTVSPVAGKPGTFDVITPSGKVTRFKPSKELAESLKDYSAPEWVTNAKGKASLREIDPGTLPNVRWFARKGDPVSERNPSPTSESKVAVDQNGKTGAQPAETLHPQTLPLKGSLEQHLTRANDRWSESHKKDLQRSEKIDTAIADAKLEYEAVLAKTKQELGAAKDLDLRLQRLERTPEHPLSKAKDTLRDLEIEKIQLGTKLKLATERRATDLQNGLDQFCLANNLPPVKLVASDLPPGVTTQYNPTAGELHVSRQRLLSSSHTSTGGLGSFETIMRSSMESMSQHLYARDVAQRSLHAAHGNFAKAKEIYKTHTGYEPTDAFLRSVQRNKPTEVASPQKQQILESAKALVKEVLSPEIESALGRVEKAATAENGNLNPKLPGNRDAIRNRELIEKELKEGTLTPQQCDRLLKLNDVEFNTMMAMMRNGTCSKSTLEKHLSGSPEKLSELAKTPPSKRGEPVPAPESNSPKPVESKSEISPTEVLAQAECKLRADVETVRQSKEFQSKAAELNQLRSRIGDVAGQEIMRLDNGLTARERAERLANHIRQGRPDNELSQTEKKVIDGISKINDKAKVGEVHEKLKTMVTGPSDSMNLLLQLDIASAPIGSVHVFQQAIGVKDFVADAFTAYKKVEKLTDPTKGGLDAYNRLLRVDFASEYNMNPVETFGKQFPPDTNYIENALFQAYTRLKQSRQELIDIGVSAKQIDAFIAKYQAHWKETIPKLKPGRDPNTNVETSRSKLDGEPDTTSAGQTLSSGQQKRYKEFHSKEKSFYKSAQLQSDGSVLIRAFDLGNNSGTAKGYFARFDEKGNLIGEELHVIYRPDPITGKLVPTDIKFKHGDKEDAAVHVNPSERQAFFKDKNLDPDKVLQTLKPQAGKTLEQWVTDRIHDLNFKSNEELMTYLNSQYQK